MEQPEVPLEAVSEHIHHQAEHAQERWILGVALTSAILAAFAAIGSLLAGHHANEAMIDQIAASDHWSYYQAKGVKAAVLGSKMETLQALGQANSAADEEKLKRYGREQEEIQKQAQEKQAGSARHLQTHTIFARSVTMFQVAIAVAAISVLTKRRRFWLISMAFGIAGIVFLIQGAFTTGHPLS
jgi:heme/copper-type cytochrome/quinol oxidase subunit 4